MHQSRAVSCARGSTDGSVPEEEVMPDTFREYCCSCPYNTESIQPEDLPLSIERNSDDVLLILQAPGHHEWENKIPLCLENEKPPDAAARIRNSVRRITGERNEWRRHFSITNAVQCYVGPRGEEPDPAAREQCANWLQCDIVSRPWRKIVVFGEPARQSIEELGYDCDNDERFRFIHHPSGGLTNDTLDDTLSWALGLNNADG